MTDGHRDIKQSARDLANALKGSKGLHKQLHLVKITNVDNLASYNTVECEMVDGTRINAMTFTQADVQVGTRGFVMPMHTNGAWADWVLITVKGIARNGVSDAYKGNWSSAYGRYKKDDQVKYKKQTWVCLKDHDSSNANRVPGSAPNHWKLYGKDGPAYKAGGWKPDLTYEEGDIVRQGGRTYIANKDVSAGIKPGSAQDTSNHWDVFTDKGLNPRSEDWKSNEPYEEDDVVKHKGNQYRSRQTHTSTEARKPSVKTNNVTNDNDYWELFVEKGGESQGDYNPNTEYDRGDVVLYNGEAWRYVNRFADSNIIPGSNANYWKKISTKGEPGLPGSPGIVFRGIYTTVEYVKNDVVIAPGSGNMYVANLTTTNQSPDNDANVGLVGSTTRPWALYQQRGVDGSSYFTYDFPMVDKAEQDAALSVGFTRGGQNADSWVNVALIPIDIEALPAGTLFYFYSDVKSDLKNGTRVAIDIAKGISRSITGNLFSAFQIDINKNTSRDSVDECNTRSGNNEVRTCNQISNRLVADGRNSMLLLRVQASESYSPEFLRGLSCGEASAKKCARDRTYPENDDKDRCCRELCEQKNASSTVANSIGWDRTKLFCKYDKNITDYRGTASIKRAIFRMKIPINRLVSS